MKKRNMEKGVTLIALAITIVVLIILAAVSIKGILDQRSIVKEAQKGRDMTANATIREDEDITEIMDDYNQAMLEAAKAGEEVQKPSGWTSDKVIAISDGKGGRVPLPSGFFYVGGDKGSGLVISDKAGDTMSATFPNSGNQFVWIPVSGEADLKRTNFDDNGKPTTGLSTDYTEPYATGYSTEGSEYSTMKAQVLKYGGFYIGRYEAGDGTNGTTFRTATTEAHTVVTKKGVVPYNFVPWGTSMSNIGTSASPSGAVYLAKNMYASSQSVTSTLCYGSQWDAMCRYIGDANRNTGSTGVSLSSVSLTGSASTDVSKNIYDLATNCFTWTMEASTSSPMRAYRGGMYYSNTPICYRNSVQPTFTAEYYAFRPALYIK